ncbi:MAG: ABC transporter ATP-binding protein [Planctomycetota bacterium]
MSPFWSYARGMLRYRWVLVGALAFAGVSAGGVGAGLLAVAPLLRSILNDGMTLGEMASDLNANELVGGRIPPGWIDALPEGEFTAVIWIVCGLGLLTLLGAAANFLHQYLSLTVVFRSVTNLRREAFHRALRFPLLGVVTEGPSNSIARIVMDTQALGAGFNALLSKAVAQVSKGLIAFVAALLIDFWMTLIAVAVAPVLYLVLHRVGRRIRRASRTALQHTEGLYGAATEALQGLRVVKVHTTERYEAGRFHRLNKGVMREMMRVRTARALASPLVEMITLVVLGGLSLIAAKAILDGHLEAESFIAVLVALGAAGASLKPLTGIIADIQGAAGAADRIHELLAQPNEPGHGVGLPKLARHAQAISFEGVSFRYPKADALALDDVSVEIAHGETIAVVGPNGSGKTTLLALVPRLFDPSDGAVRIDGEDIRDVGVRSLRRQIGVVTQETVLFRGTIGDNIAYGAEGATTERVVEAAHRARAHEFIDRLPAGYDTPVGEQGATLSGGQRQRIAIARAVLRDPAILILDEATSMIDADSEAKIADAVAEFGAGRTVLIVAHRLSTVVGADRILVMDQGRLVDQGSHDELLDRCETYRLIARRQLVGGGAPATSAEVTTR